MTSLSTTRPAPGNVFGPYSPWPRRQRSQRRAMITVGLAIAAGAVFVHCVVPML